MLLAQYVTIVLVIHFMSVLIIMFKSFAIHKENIQAQLDTDHIPPSERTCFMCKCNLAWRNRPDVDIAHCGPYMRMGVPENTPPDTAKTCRGFVPKG